jgi:hypothetical protein
MIGQPSRNKRKPFANPCRKILFGDKLSTHNSLPVSLRQRSPRKYFYFDARSDN